MTYYLRELAKSDLEEIWLYSFERWGIEQAEAYTRSLLSKMRWLSLNPLLGKSRDDITPGYYCFSEGQHIIFYQRAGKDIEVIGILHHSMDAVDHFIDSNEEG